MIRDLHKTKIIDKGFPLSEKFKSAVKEEFDGMNLKLELIINQGGLQSGKAKFKIL